MRIDPAVVAISVDVPASGETQAPASAQHATRAVAGRHPAGVRVDPTSLDVCGCTVQIRLGSRLDPPLTPSLLINDRRGAGPVNRVGT